MSITSGLMKKNLFVFNDGFTLLEALLSLFIMSFLLFLLINFSFTIKKSIHEGKEQKELTMLVAHMQEDLIESKKSSIFKNKLNLMKYNKEKVTYEFKNKELVRKVNGKGYEIVLQDIEGVAFYKKNNLIKMNIFYGDKINEEVVSVG